MAVRTMALRHYVLPRVRRLRTHIQIRDTKYPMIELEKKPVCNHMAINQHGLLAYELRLRLYHYEPISLTLPVEPKRPMHERYDE